MDIQANYLEKILGDNQEAKFAIREIPHFQFCSEDLLNLIYSYGRIYSLREGECLTREGEFDQWVYFLLSGTLTVIVGGEKVDNISASMVGESCIFGEPHNATLNASDGGVVALGIDMAILDKLQGDSSNSGGNASKDAHVFVELLSIVTGEIIDRIADLAYIQLDVASKLAINIKADEVGDIISGLIKNAYSGDPQVNIAMYKYLMRRDKALLALSLQPDKITVDTRKFYSHIVNQGTPELALEMAQVIYDVRQGDSYGEDGITGYLGSQNFNGFVGDAFQKAADHYASVREGQQNSRELTEHAWREHFRMGDDMRIELPGFCRWLKSTYGYTDLQVVEILILILREASRYTAEINMTTKDMMSELSQIKGLKKLEGFAGGGEVVISLFFDSRTAEEMIPLFSRHVLDVHLINPYLERLGEPQLATAGDAVATAGAAGAAATPAPAADATAGEAEAQLGSDELVDSLFD